MPYKDSEVRFKKNAERLRRLRATPGYSTAKNLKWKTANRAKYLAHKAVENALKSGRPTKQPCEVCKSERVEAHHDNYEERLNVRWLCRTHHEKIHHAQTAVLTLASDRIL